MSFLKDIKTAAELEAYRLESLASAARAKRDALIKETDFYMLPDYPAVPTRVAEYRHGIEKQLRTAEEVGDDVAFNAISWTFVQPEAPVA